VKVAIVILNWNGRQLLEQFLPSILTYSKDLAEIYVADNASTDDSLVFVKAKFPEVTIVSNQENGGYAKGYNDALQHIQADIYALVNSDIEVTENWLVPILNQFKEEPKTAAIQPKLLDFKNKSTFEYAGAAGGFIDAYGYPYCRGRLFNELEVDNGQYNENTTIFWASGACFFIRASVFHNLNGFDERYFAHQEEIDLCWRIQNVGFTIKYNGNSTVFHVGGATLDKANPHKTFLNFRNSLYSIVKNIPKQKLIPVLLSRLLLDGFAGLKFLLELKPKHTFAILKAHLSFYTSFPYLLQKRKEIITKKQDYYGVKSIVWQYYVMARKKFSDLD
tara:strand:+ start:358900 stop:359901 length:1002 start_codon:yes stop_codon:yes gene_type:complete